MPSLFRVTPDGGIGEPIDCTTYREAVQLFIDHVNTPDCKRVELWEVDDEVNWAMELCKFSRER